MRWLRRIFGHHAPHDQHPQYQAGQLVRSIPVMAARAGGSLRDGIAAASNATIRRFGPGGQPQGGTDTAMRPMRRRRDPAPSRLRYRLTRLWLTPSWRRVIRIGVPLAIVTMVLTVWLSDEGSRAAIAARYDNLRETIQNREEFMVHRMEVTGASSAVEKGLRGMLPVDLPASSFHIDLKQLRSRIMALDAVASVELRIKPGGTLAAVVTERDPALLWRRSNSIDMIDAEGHRVASVTAREVRKDLPLIAGEGANRAAAEALALIDAAGSILPRLRGLERRGERRWDVVLDKGQRIMLPADDPVSALKYALALSRDQDLLARDVRVVDLRDPQRLVLRMGLDAQNAIRQARGQPLLDEDGHAIDEAAGVRTASTGAAG